MILTTSAAGRALIERWEGCRLHSYRDIVGVWTIGYGCTGLGIGPGMEITQVEADAMLTARLLRFEADLNLHLAGAATTQGQFDALISLAYNIGSGAEDRSTPLRLHRAGQWQEAADSFLLYDHAGGMENDALELRRNEEAQMYLDASPDSADGPDSSDGPDDGGSDQDGGGDGNA